VSSRCGEAANCYLVTGMMVLTMVKIIIPVYLDHVNQKNAQMSGDLSIDVFR